ncbi:uncharacterized protein LOC110833473 isoform X2 [Zootermopsis nevadensis]|uniref:uncharacterized protein LOC110833473 isoform X2 n=1 Tax=Zootermopsis nevadensis TaxID=136037 RepID=UPI000B8E47BB|nr:uncharacterized protein LOC110833473 isoform X2 [Zootermopsis nevadensis]
MVSWRGKMHGARRVVMFCLLTAVLPTVLLIIPLYLRHSIYADVIYAVAESDVLEILDGISTVFCQGHSLKMNSSFHAFQLAGMPDLSPNRKHIRLKKSMSLPDDTLEYWGFYLLKGSTVVLSVCSRYEGSRVMVVKGEKNLKTCGLLDHKEGAVHPNMASGQGQVRVTFDTVAQEVHSKQEASPLKRVTHLPAEDFEGEDQSGDAVNASETLAETDNITALEHYADQFIRRHSAIRNETDSANNSSSLVKQNTQHVRHARKKIKGFESHVSDPKKSHSNKKEQRSRQNKHLEGSPKRGRKDESERMSGAAISENRLRKNDEEGEIQGKTPQKVKRAVHFGATHILDGGIEHGGNAGNMSETDDTESSVSSFENSLLTCYDGQILLAQSFLPSPTCSDVHAIEKHGTMETVHEVIADGYYYYIFYSDNDYVQNDIHAVFNIHKPTYQYAKHSRACFNQTECNFPITFWSDEIVIVEVPTRDGIEHEEDDITYLISSCYPRMSVYVVFPVAVLFLILGCAFM